MRVGRFEFPTKKAAREFDKNVRCAPLRVLEGQDFEWARSLLDLHPTVEDKIGCGVKDIEVVIDFGQFKYEVVRTDGTRAEFSIQKCFSGKQQSVQAQIYAAFRQAVHLQIRSFRDLLFSQGPVYSSVSGVLLEQDSSCHIDHHPTSFKQLVEEFCAGEQLAVGDVVVHNRHNLPNGHFEFQDEALAERWSNFHQEHARLRPVTARENLTRH